MSNTRYLGTAFSGGLRLPNYVNGRLLHAEDLRADQSATAARLTNLGRAAGPGVVEGLTVRTTPGSTNSLQVNPGLGINARGDLLHLSGNPVTLALLIEPEISTIQGDAGLFQPCVSVTPGENITLDEGAYLLAVAPVSRMEGNTPLSSSSGSSSTVECAATWQVEGLEFKAIRLSSFGSAGVDTGPVATRRNRLAHWCLGSRALATFPFADYGGGYSGLDRLPATDLSRCDLPLAVFYWSDGSIAFVDLWAARRRPSTPYVAPAWGGFFGQKRVAEGEARLLQFQEHLTGLLTRTDINPQALRAADHFEYVPPIGFLPTTTLPNQALFGGGFLTINIFLSGGKNPGSLNYPAWLVAWLFEPIAERINQESGAFVRLPEFWGERLPETAEFIDLEQVDLLLERTRHQDALDMAQDSAIKIYFVAEYLVLYLARLLLDGINFTSDDGSFDLLDILGGAGFGNLASRDDNPDRLEPAEWFVRSLSIYLNMPLNRLEETLDQVTFPHVMFAKEIVAPVSFPLEIAEPDPAEPIGDLAAVEPLRPATGTTLVNTPGIDAINSNLNRSGIERTNVVRDLTGTIQPVGMRSNIDRSRVFRRLRRR
jgi:hypothetical protein